MTTHLRQAWAARIAASLEFKHFNQGPIKVISLVQGGQQIARLEYSLPRKNAPDQRVRINSVWTDHNHRRQGHATALLRELEARYPDKGIDPGDFTEVGRKWWEGVEHTGAWLPDDPLPPGWRWALNDDEDPMLIQPPVKYGPIMTEAQAKAKGWYGPVYHGTTPANAASIRRQGFRTPRLEDYELEDWGTIEEVINGDTIVIWFVEDEAAARAYGGDAVVSYLRPGKYRPMAGIFTGEPALVVDDEQNAAVISDHKREARRTAGLGYNPERDLPPNKPGTKSVPSGSVRAFHYTSPSNVGSIMSGGLRGSFAQQFDYDGEGIWAAAGVPQAVKDALKGHEVNRIWIEFWTPVDKLYLGGGTGVSASWLEQRNAHIVSPDVPVSQFLGIYFPWHFSYWHLKEDARTLKDVMEGMHDNLMTDPDYKDSVGKAIKLIKAGK